MTQVPTISKFVESILSTDDATMEAVIKVYREASTIKGLEATYSALADCVEYIHAQKAR